MNVKRVTLFAGHYGSGKTNIAVNFAKALRSEGKEVTICDLDIVNPYFRTKDSEKELSALGIRVICPEFANSNVDLPALPAQVYDCFSDRTRYAVLDIGGDDRGAVALGRYIPSILEENDYEMIFVANFYRPLTKTPEEALEVMREIEAACRLNFTAIVNNSNLGSLSTPEVLTSTFEKAEKLSALSSLPILFSTAESRVCAQMKTDSMLFPLILQEKYYE